MSIFLFCFVIEWPQIAHVQSCRFVCAEEVDIIGAFHFTLDPRWPVREVLKFGKYQRPRL